MPKEEFEIVDVVHTTPNELLKGHFRVEKRDEGVLELIGWALGERSQVARIEVRCGDAAIAASEPSVKRPDIAEAFEDRPEAGACGFEIAIEAQGEGESHLELEAQLEDGTATPLGALRVKAPRRRWRELFRRS
jgi:hypothetical protein